MNQSLPILILSSIIWSVYRSINQSTNQPNKSINHQFDIVTLWFSQMLPEWKFSLSLTNGKITHENWTVFIRTKPLPALWATYTSVYLPEAILNKPKVQSMVQWDMKICDHASPSGKWAIKSACRQENLPAPDYGTQSLLKLVLPRIELRLQWWGRGCWRPNDSSYPPLQGWTWHCGWCPLPKWRTSLALPCPRPRYQPADRMSQMWHPSNGDLFHGKMSAGYQNHPSVLEHLTRQLVIVKFSSWLLSQETMWIYTKTNQDLLFSSKYASVLVEKHLIFQETK